MSGVTDKLTDLYKRDGDKDEHWMKSRWRPAMAWVYLLICLMDFVVFPSLVMIMPPVFKILAGIEIVYVPWTSLTLTAGGLIHLAFGGILYAATKGRTEEKIAKVN